MHNTQIQERLHRLAARQRFAAAVSFAAYGLFVGGCAGAAILGARAIARADIVGELLPVLGACLGLGVLIGGVFGSLKRPDPLALARALDRAADSKDQFASAYQLLRVSPPNRSGLAVRSAIDAVGTTPADAAIPLRVPRLTRWTALAVALAVLVSVIAPGPVVSADVAPRPEITPEQWDRISEQTRDELDALAEDEHLDQEIREMLEQLAALVETRPDKQDALAQVARIKAELERRRAEAGSPERSAAQAARAIARSEALKEFARKLSQGQYNSSADSLDSLASQLEAGTAQLTASDFEDIASDMADLSEALKNANKQLSESASRCSQSAGSMSDKDLAEAMRRMSEQMRSCNNSMCRTDSRNRAESFLDKLRRMMNQKKQCSSCSGGGCSSCKSGSGNGFLKPGAGKGGLRAGRGTVEDWTGGSLADRDAGTVQDMIDPAETDGAQMTFPTISSDEDGQSGRSHKEVYAELVKQAEAELGLESVPHAYREYLRRYFLSISPEERPDADATQ